MPKRRRLLNRRLLSACLRLDGSGFILLLQPFGRRARAFVDATESLVEIDVSAHRGVELHNGPKELRHLGEAHDLRLRFGLHQRIGELELEFLAAERWRAIEAGADRASALEDVERRLTQAA